MTRRAASIWRAVKRPRPRAFRPYSPKLTLLPVVAMPLLRPFCILRYFCLAGCSIFCPRLSYFLFWFSCSTPGSFFRVSDSRSFFWLCGNSSRLITLVTENFALEYPDLDTDNAVSGLGLGHAVVNIGTQGMQWHSAFAIPFSTGNFNTIQAARAHDLDALCAQAHGILHRTLHGAVSYTH